MCWFIYTGGRLLGSLFGGIGMLIGGVLGFCAVLGISFMMRGWPTWLSNIILWPAYLAWAGYQYVYPFVKFYRLKKQNQKVKDLNREIDDL